MKPRLDILPPAQLALWPELRAVPGQFVLYGGTAIALRLAHRQSVDFDFFSSGPFVPHELRASLPFLAGSELLQVAPNTLTVRVTRPEPVKLSFFGALPIGRVGTPERTDDGVLQIASLLDLAGTKAVVVQQRSEAKDYLDLHHLLLNGVPLAAALGAAQALYGEDFQPVLTLKALAHFGDGDLPTLPTDIQSALRRAAGRVTGFADIQRRAASLHAA
ncbi:MAG: hypothetical protein B9S33_20460 [Pedosphaera sp. Tous-C6FEB]|nr:MAG: hypothetical protein B9S33_20460 [Pedosphaera sp. Tous-C6FEB]